MSHANARFTPAGRLLMIRRIEAGMPQAHVARQMGLSRGTVAKWWNRYLAEGEAGLVDRSSRPHSSPRRTPARLEERICRLRRSTRRGPVYLSARTGVPAATIWRILCRNGLNRLSWIDRPTGRVIRRYERSSPGELVHLDPSSGTLTHTQSHVSARAQVLAKGLSRYGRRCAGSAAAPGRTRCRQGCRCPTWRAHGTARPDCRARRASAGRRHRGRRTESRGQAHIVRGGGYVPRRPARRGRGDEGPQPRGRHPSRRTGR